MPRIILVHGGCHGAWCWDEVVAQLPQAQAIQLPGHGRIAARAGLKEGIAAVCAALECIDAPITLLGHSLGGMTISGVAEAMPMAVRRLVYLTAQLPRDGESAATLPLPPLGAWGAATFSEDGHWTGLDPVRAPPIFYQDCSAEAVARTLPRLGDTDLDYVTTPVTLTERFDAIAKTYIHCSADRAIQIEAQRIMVARYPGIEIAELDSGHSPFLGMPGHLADLLRSLV